MFRNLKIMATLFTFMVIGGTFTSIASAECGPGFSNKKQLIRYVKNDPSYAHGLRKELLKHSAYAGYNADETVLNYIRNPEQVVKVTPTDYELKSNTYCPGGPGDYQPFHGLFDNMGGLPMLWHCPKGGKCVPLLKGYCMNFVMGPGIGHPHHPKKHKPHKCKCHKCGCHKKKPKPKTPLSCEAQGLINGPNGTCVTQIVTVTPKQECEANNHSTTGCTQETTTVVINCGNYSSGNSGTVEQGDNCTQKEEENTCVDSSCNSEEEPCGCKEPKPEIRITSMTELNQIPFGKISQEVHIGTYASESGGVLTVDPGIGSVSPCGSSSPKGVFTAEVPSGSSEACVVFTAPEDGDEPEYMVVTVTACIGSVCAEKIQKVKITYDQYPG